jgi:hypothetical protein
VLPEVLERFREHVAEVAEKPGPVATLSVPLTPDEEAACERAWIDKLDGPQQPFKVIRSIATRSR